MSVRRIKTQCACVLFAVLALTQAAYAEEQTMLHHSASVSMPTPAIMSPATPVDPLSSVLDQNLQSVVSVSFSYNQNDLFSGAFDEHLFSDLLGDHAGEHSRFVTSGIIVDENGYVLTHIPTANMAGEWQITLPDNSQHQANLVGADPISGFALLKINATHLIPVKTVASTEKHFSSWSLAIGRPYANLSSVVAGHITSWHAHAHLSPYQSYIETDIHNGVHADGGLLVDSHGQAEGVVIVLSHPSGYTNTLAVPLDEALDIAHQLQAHGRVNYGYLGVIVEDRAPVAADKKTHIPAEGVLVSSVRPGSPADRAHLMAGDYITHINTADIHSVYDLMRVVGQSAPGTRTVIDVMRQGKHQRLIAMIAGLPEVKSDVRSIHISMVDSKVSPFAGASFAVISDKDKSQYHIKEGIKITAVKKGSPAERMGLTVGAIIVKVNGKTVSHVQTLQKILSQQHSSVAVMMRNQLINIDIS